MGDNWETENGMDVFGDDALTDTDLDGYCNLREFLSGTDPNAKDVPPPIADNDEDNDVDAVDLSILIGELNRVDCSPSTPCDCDFDNNGEVNIIDFMLFIEDFGRADGPVDADDHSGLMGN